MKAKLPHGKSHQNKAQDTNQTREIVWRPIAAKEFVPRLYKNSYKTTRAFEN